MSLITVSSLAKSYGPTDIFSGVSFSVVKGARMAIVGPNGIGKTSLMRILVGADEPTSGTVSRTRGVRIGYLSQEADFKMTGTIWSACESVFDHFKAEQEELHRLEGLMSDPDQLEEVMGRYGKLQEDFERRGGYTYTTKIRTVLTGLGFSEADYQLDLDHLSGGQRTRGFLARLLLEDPDLLLLDEPTNHLDIAAVEWLEGYLSQWEGAAIIISHDRFFLDKASNAILEMFPGATEMYRGNYSAYLKQRAERMARRQEVFDSEKEKLQKEMEYIRKNVAGQNVLQAKGKLKRISRLIQAIEQIGMEAALKQKWIETASEVAVTTSILSVEEAGRRINALQSPVRQLPNLHLRLAQAARSGDMVIRTEKLEVGFSDKFLFRSPNIDLRRGDCAALIGPNGAGKSTFLKTILGQIPPLAGTVTLGESLHIGYFAQAHESLDPKKSVIDEIIGVTNWLPQRAREYLGKYLFSGDDAFKMVSMLSGGERGRLALAKLALQDTNLLLLDEPTNHLDIPSQEILEAVLDDYEGTILLVTHDRYLVDAIATQIWEIDTDESHLIIFKGIYSQLKEEREKDLARRAAAQAEREETESHKKETPKAKSANTKEDRKKNAKRQELENKIAALEAKLSEIGEKLAHPPKDAGVVIQLAKDYDQVQKEMDEKLAEWEALQR
ncbi:ribosomal protection-like ABC-F family protein [Candidatus Villigracilis affinis]|uniref:ribosomal protection-like ABC-F family protein n=1 Tax=Candidatus Villigracilis affinis TaxID=3140682 RepID=UPI001D2ED92A|nr:ABC-F family ATP-binding cassette domain-containing protein [Anaerolineales bacterium]